MKFSRAHIREYKSIRDSGPFELGDATCLVGKNEAGKTALLEALYRLNPVAPEHGTFDVTNDFPRADVEDYRQDLESGRRTRHATVIEATFTLDPVEIEEAQKDFGPEVFRTPTVVLSKGYENSLHVDVDVDEAAAVPFLVNKANLPGDVRKKALESTSLKSLFDYLEATAQAQQKAHKEAHAAAQAMPETDPQAKAKALDDAGKLQESQSAKQLRAELAPIVKEGFGLHLWTNYLADYFPRFLYFDEYYQMEGQVNIQKLGERQKSGQLLGSDRPMLGLIDLARIKLEELVSPQNTQDLVNKLEGASNHLSKQVLKYWSQNKHISLRFDIRPALPGDPEGMREGTNLWASVHDAAHQATVRLGTRSRGFVWFFSFLAWFSQQKKLNYPLILLLDEPALFLHASAQADLLRYVEAELKPYHQVIFTTHSPFMIDPQHFERVRIVRDRNMELDEPLPLEESGTKVLSDVFEADEGTLFPLQGALAFDLTQTLFVGPNVLVVEGTSDLLYLQTMRDVLRQAGCEALSPTLSDCLVCFGTTRALASDHF